MDTDYMTRVVREFGQRLRNDFPLSVPAPFSILLMLEHLRRAEEAAANASVDCGGLV